MRYRQWNVEAEFDPGLFRAEEIRLDGIGLDAEVIEVAGNRRGNASEAFDVAFGGLVVPPKAAKFDEADGLRLGEGKALGPHGPAGCFESGGDCPARMKVGGSGLRCNAYNVIEEK